LSADRTYTITPSASARAEQNFTATAGQTTFTITGGYVVGLVDVFINGARLLPTDYTATNGTTVVLGTGALLNDAVTVLNYTSTIAALPTSRDVIDYTATAAQTTFTVTGGYVVGLLDVYVNGSKLTSAEFTATNGTTFVLTEASVVGNQVQAIRYNASVTGISGSGTANYVPKFTASQTVGNSLIFDNGTNVGISTNSPNSKLDVLGTIRASASSTQFFEIGYDTGANQGYIQSVQNGVAYRNTLINPNGGSVGIGSSSPLSLLEIKGATPFFRITDTATSGETGIIMDANGAIRGGLTINYSTGEYKSYCGVSGNGFFQTFYTNGTERMRITAAGNVGIGTSSPTSLLHVKGSGNYNGLIRIDNSTAIGGGILDIFQNGVASGFFGARGAALGNTARDLTLYAVAGLGIYTYTNDGVSGPYVTSGGTSWTSSSDERLKTIKNIIPNAVDSILQLRAVIHTWKYDNEQKEHLGLIAQDIQKVYPQIVVENDDDIKTLGVNYTELIPVLVKAIQELSAKIDILENK
jgi:hypothetical protein